MPGGVPSGTRVALISSSYAPYVGGVEEHVRHVARALVEEGIGVEVWTVDRGEHLGTRCIDGIVVRYLATPLPARQATATLRFLARMPRAWRAWRGAFDEFQPHLLHVHCFGPNGIYALALHRWKRTPLAVTSHGETFMDDRGAFRRSALLRRGLTRALKDSVFVTAPSEYTLADLRASYGLREAHVVPNGVDPRITAIPVGTSGIGGPYLAAVGRLGWMKGFDLLVEAFSLADLPRVCRLVIGGSGPEREAVERLIIQKGLAGRVELLGELSPVDVATVMTRSLAVVVPSRMEAFGIVALEAWRAGAPLIMTNRGGASEFVKDGIDGLLVDPADVVTMAEVMRNVVDDGALRLRLARAGSKRIAEFSWPRVAAEYRRLYDEALYAVRRGQHDSDGRQDTSSHT